MEKPKRNLLWLFMGLAGIGLLGWFINAFSPNSVQLLLTFFSIITATVFFLSLFVLRQLRYAILTTLGIFAWLVLRFFGLREVYYGILLVAILVSLEVLLRKS